ncbi:hypothetical protein [Nonomuraea sp. LPB2021202275-12-8]|uniref:hypothetical protein n=1 Tax=Nonomuraea sp. LPB2021202275-12-8 TaxID=3120159 RepID=UPI00300D932E
MIVETSRQVRWPAYVMAGLFLGYAAGKAVFAAQGRLGFPGGPVVPAEEYERYAREVMGVTTAQWSAVATGLLGAVLVMLTVTKAGRRVPRVPMLIGLTVALVAVGAGATIMVVDGFVGLGVGWGPHHGVLGLVVIGLLVATIWSYARATRRVTA